MNSLKDGWFSELSPLWPGQALSLEVEEEIFHQKSEYQDIVVFQSKSYGRVLALDGVIQTTDRDEFSYQEMMAHLPLFSHPEPRDVLIIGGGDGGVVREIDKHNVVETITQCEIDSMVVEVSKKYLPGLSVGYNSRKLNQYIGDGVEYMRKNKDKFDVIITDASDPIGPAEKLFEREYFQLIKDSLKPGGLLCSQGESMWLHLELIRSMSDFCKILFPVVEYASLCIPTYPCGQIGILLCSKNEETNFREPIRELATVNNMGLRYYNKNVHSAAFVLPQFVEQSLGGVARRNTEDGDS